MSRWTAVPSWPTIARILEWPPRTRPKTLPALKKWARKRRKKLALKYHPDRGGSVARMQEINALLDAIQATMYVPWDREVQARTVGDREPEGAPRPKNRRYTAHYVHDLPHVGVRVIFREY